MIPSDTFKGARADLPRVLVNESISSSAPMADRLANLLALFDATDGEGKFALFAELASTALVNADISRLRRPCGAA